VPADASEPQTLSEPDLAEMLHRGLTLHRSGELSGAEQIYQAILRQRRDHFDAVYLLGVIALQMRRAEQAAELWSGCATEQQ
jgi:thioredoxin-like negative regulator of GroEL